MVLPFSCLAPCSSSILGKDKGEGTGILTAYFSTTNCPLPFYPAITQVELFVIVARYFSGRSFLFWRTLEKSEPCVCVAVHTQVHTNSFVRPQWYFGKQLSTKNVVLEGVADTVLTKYSMCIPTFPGMLCNYVGVMWLVLVSEYELKWCVSHWGWGS